MMFEGLNLEASAGDALNKNLNSELFLDGIFTSGAAG
jgi:hypothetical protein